MWCYLFTSLCNLRIVWLPCLCSFNIMALIYYSRCMLEFVKLLIENVKLRGSMDVAKSSKGPLSQSLIHADAVSNLHLLWELVQIVHPLRHVGKRHIGSFWSVSSSSWTYPCPSNHHLAAYHFCSFETFQTSVSKNLTYIHAALRAQIRTHGWGDDAPVAPQLLSPLAFSKDLVSHTKDSRRIWLCPPGR